MSVSYGFYNSVDGDRTYDAEQMSSIFDGILEDGILRSQGNCFAVAASSGMNITVDTGRAWFNHTWTLNDAKLTLTVPDSNQTLPRIDTVVLEVNADPDTRANSIKIVEGTAASEPTAPTLTQDDDAQVWQYPLAYISVEANTSSIISSNITSAIGTDTAYALGILDLSTQAEMDGLREDYDTLSELPSEVESLANTVESNSYVIGSYTGNGDDDWYKISVGFTPRYVLATHQGHSASSYIVDAIRLAQVGNNNSSGYNIKLVSGGFAVRCSESTPLPQMNIADMVYDYMAFS